MYVCHILALFILQSIQIVNTKLYAVVEGTEDSSVNYFYYFYASWWSYWLKSPLAFVYLFIYLFV